MNKEEQSTQTISPRWVIEGEGIRLEVGRRTLVMGVLNVTPDSFSDGGTYLSPDHALAHAETMAAEGADLIDIGGESSRPGSDPVSLEEELRRVVPVIERVTQRIPLPVSIDSTKSEVARRALEAGARIVNDISALRADPGMAAVVVKEEVPVVLMHMKGSPKTMQEDPRYDSVVDAVDAFFGERIRSAQESGIPESRLILDPGIGFGKTIEHNLEIIRSLGRLSGHGRPLLIGPSRKSFIGTILDLPVEERLEGTAAAITAGILAGASIVRVHDVKAMRRVVRLADSIRSGRPVIN